MASYLYDYVCEHVHRAVDAAVRWWYRAPGGGSGSAGSAGSGATRATRVAQALAFSVGGEDLGYCQRVHVDPEAWAGEGWEDDVAAQTGFERFRVEVRLVDPDGTKRRVLLYPGDACEDPTFPPPDRFAARQPLRRVVHAMLVGMPGIASMNIYSRARKYSGTRVRDAHHMFPFDDHEDNATRFSCVRVMYLDMTVEEMPLLARHLSAPASPASTPPAEDPASPAEDPDHEA